jgi:hypothetical protein
MDAEAQHAAVLARLERIGAFDRRAAPAERGPGEQAPRALIGELRSLLVDADLPVAPSAHGEEVVERLRTAPHGT